MLDKLAEAGAFTKSGSINGAFFAHKFQRDEYRQLRESFLEASRFCRPDATWPERVWFVRNNLSLADVTCDRCGKYVKFNSTTGFQRFCSPACANKSEDKKEATRQTNITRYGGHPRSTQEVIDKAIATNIARYGVDNPAKVETFKQKARQTSLERYGSEYHSSSDIGKEQRKASNLQALGVEYPFQRPDIRDKALRTIQDRYGVASTSQLAEVSAAQLSTKYRNQFGADHTLHETLFNEDWVRERYEVDNLSQQEIAELVGMKDRQSVGTRMREWGISARSSSNVSAGERQLVEFIQSLGLEVRKSDRTIIAPQELDIVIPSHNFAIEYCGLYWHSDVHKDRNYHLRKLERCVEAGYRLLTVFEDEWKDSRAIVEAAIRHKLGCNTSTTIGARKTTIRNVDVGTAREFLEINHIQGDGPGSINKALVHEGNIIAVATFIKHKDKLVLNRYATNVTVPGGLSKLVKSALTEYNMPIESFADRRWSDGGMYAKAGFTLVDTLRPDYRYIINNKRAHKFAFRHKFLETKLPNYDPTISETENMRAAGYNRIFDCGLLKYRIEP